MTSGTKLEIQLVNTKTKPERHTMKEALALIYAALIAPLVEAINANTAAISASKSSCTGTPPLS